MGEGRQFKRHQKKAIIAAFILVCILITIYLVDFRIAIRELEYTRGIESLKDLTVQGVTIAENKIEGVADILRNTADFMENVEDFQSEKSLEYLKNITVDGEKGVVTIGIADENGDARVADGRTMNVAERSFFRESMAGKEYISSVLRKDTGSVLVSVPIHNTEGEAKGVLYGIINKDYFRLYTNTKWDVDEEDQYIHIIDRYGNYIVRSKSSYSIIENENIYDGISEVESSVPVDKIKEAVGNNETILTKLDRADDGRYVYFAPMDINDWCMVTVLNEEMIENQVVDSRDIVMGLIIKLILTLAALGGLWYMVFTREKREIEELNQELLFKDKLFKIAVSESGDFIFTYDMRTKVLEFLNYDEKKLHIPRVIENFADEVFRYVEEGSDRYLEIKRLIAEIEQGADKAEGEIAISLENGENRIYRIQLNNVADKNDKMYRTVGMLADITEEKEQEFKLKKGEQIRSTMLADAVGFFEVNLSKDCLMRDGVNQIRAYTFTEVLNKFTELKVRSNDREKVKEVFDVKNLMDLYEQGIYDTSLEYVRLEEDGTEFWAVSEIHLEKDIMTDDIVALTVVRNINDKKEQELKLQDQAVLDPLTKAYNRGVGAEKINEILAEKPDAEHAFMVIDLDGFKQINDTFGHIKGDKVLIEVVKILKHHVRTEDVICRLGGDEFVVFLREIPREAIHRNVTKLLEKLMLTYSRGDVTRKISASIGIVITPQDGTEFVTLYEKADKALYEVKRNGKNGYKIYGEK